MSLLNSLQLQQIDDSNDDLSQAKFVPDDDIALGDQIDEGALENYWEQVVDDIHKDPDWFSFGGR